MADEKKTSTPTPSPEYDPFLIVFGILIIMSVVAYVNTNISPLTSDAVSSGKFFENLWLFFQGKAPVLAEVPSVFLWLKNFSIVLSVLFFAGIVWLGLRSREVHHIEHEKYAPVLVEEIEAKGRMTQWQVVLNHVNSESPAEWKLGILEADNMLDEILEEEGYIGETVADKLKAMSPSRITSYQELWEAHKVRNEIAHGNATSMELSKKTARDTITNFGKAFKELGYI